MPNHVHMLISVPPKYSVAEVIGFVKGKSSIWIARMSSASAQFHGARILGSGCFP
jgi:putative transposase